MTRLLASIESSWDEWDGGLTLKGVDIRTWSLPRMLNAYESALDQSAKDDGERAMTRAKLYAPPKDLMVQRRAAQKAGRPAPPVPATPAAGGFDLSKAQSLMAVINAEHARLGVEG